MSRELESGTISAELKSDPDYLFYGETQPNATTVTSDGMLLGKTQDALEVVGVAKTDITVGATFTTSITVEESSDDGDTDAYETVDTVYTVDGATTIPAGTELFRYVPNTKNEVYMRVAWESTDTGEVGTLDVYPVYVAR